MTDEELKELNLLMAEFDALELVRPSQKEMLDRFRASTMMEVEKGLKKSYLKRSRKENVSYAKNVLTPSQFAAFKALIEGTAPIGSSTSILEVVLRRGKLESEEEYADVMEELDRFIQNSSNLSETDALLIQTVNSLIFSFEKEFTSTK